MRKGISISIALSALLASNVVAATQDFNVEAGWNLLGAGIDVSTSQFANADTVWTYDTANMKWNVTSPNGTLTSAIEALGNELGTLSTISGGEGFWVKSGTAFNLNLSGTEAASVKVLNNGWNLISFSGTGTKDVADIFASNSNIYTVWEFDKSTNNWKAWSPSNAVKDAISAAGLTALSEVSSGKGYWVNTQMATTVGIDLTTPESVNKTIFVQNVGTDQTVIPVPGAELYVDGVMIGVTDINGEFDFSKLKLLDGTDVTVMKDGYSTSVGVIDNGVLVISIAPIDELETPPAVPALAKVLGRTSQVTETLLKSTDGSQDPIANKVLRTPSKDLVILDTANLTQSVTGTLTAYSYPEQVPMITNNITLPTGTDVNTSMGFSSTVTPEELSIISGLNISFKDANGKSILPENYNDLGLKYRVFAKNVIGDFEKIVTGLVGSTEDEKYGLNVETLKKFQEAAETGLVSFYVLLQNTDGTWKYVADAKVTVSANGIMTMSVDNGGAKLEDFGSGNIAFAIRNEAVTGTTTVCLNNGGERMFDGSVINIPTSLEAVEGAIIVGDEHVISQPAATDENGCTNIEYKVPFLSPMYQFTATKGGMYNKPVTVNIEFGNLDADQNATMLSKPEEVSIVGYVKSTLNGDVQAEDDAVVALRDPQILTAEKIVINDTEGNRSITLESAPNLTYEWTLRKDDSNESVVVSTTNVLTQEAVESVIYDETNSPWISATDASKNPYGHYKIDVVVEHEYSNTAEKFTEAMTIDFDAKIDEVALKDAFEFSVNGESAITYATNVADGNVTELDYTNVDDANILANDNIGIYSIYGGKEISKFKALKRAAVEGNELIDPDEKMWVNNVVAAGPYGDAMCVTSSDADVADIPYFAGILETNELIAQTAIDDGAEPVDYGAECAMRVLPTTTFGKSLLPFTQVYKMFYDNFNVMISNDPSKTTATPWYASGFTVLNTYKAYYDAITTEYRQYANSTTDLPSGSFNNINDFSNILNFSVNPNQAIGFATKIDETDIDGSYRIDNVPPEVIPALELMARADGTKYNTANFRKANYPDSVFTGDLAEDEIPAVTETATEGSQVTATAGDVLVHNFMLDRIAPTVEVPTKLGIYFEDNMTDNTGAEWTVEKLAINGYTGSATDSVTWQVVDNANLPAVNSSYISDVYTTDATSAPSTILPTLYGSNYAWMGNASTGTYDVTGSTGYHVATALKSPVIDFSNYSLAKLSLKSWFEVSGIDSAWDTAFIGFEIIEDENQTTDSEEILVSWNGSTWPVTVGQTYIKRITPTDQIEWDYSTSGQATTFSNNGVNALAAWSNYNLSLDFLAGKKARIVFGFFTGDSLYNNMMGWGIDNVEITDDKNYVVTTPPMPESFDEGIEVVDGNTTVDSSVDVLAAD